MCLTACGPSVLKEPRLAHRGSVGIERFPAKFRVVQLDETEAFLASGLGAGAAADQCRVMATRPQGLAEADEGQHVAGRAGGDEKCVHEIHPLAQCLQWLDAHGRQRRQRSAQDAHDPGKGAGKAHDASVNAE